MAKQVYLLEERDIWSLNENIVRLGVFSTYNKAYKSAKNNYGELEENGSKNNLVPIKNINEITLVIIEITLDEFCEF